MERSVKLTTSLRPAHLHRDFSAKNVARNSRPKTTVKDTGGTSTNPRWSEQTWFRRIKGWTVHTPPVRGKGKGGLLDVITWFNIVEGSIMITYQSDRGRINCSFYDCQGPRFIYIIFFVLGVGGVRIPLLCDNRVSFCFWILGNYL